MTNQFLIRSLESQNKKLQVRVSAFESGDFVVSLKQKHDLLISKLQRKIDVLCSSQTKLKLRIDIKENKIIELNDAIYTLKSKLADAVKENQTLTKNIKKLENENKNLKSKTTNSKLLEKNKLLNQTVDNQRIEIENLKKIIKLHESENKDLKDKNNHNESKTNKNSSNSSKPSSTDGFTKVNQNNREKSENKIGGQYGHEGRCAPVVENPDLVINCFLDSNTPNFDEFEVTEEFKIKQEIDICIKRYVTEYREYKYINKVTGEVIYAKNKKGITSRVEYGTTIKAFSLLLNDYGNVSIDKTNTLISLFTNNQIKMSNGTIQNFKVEFSNKVEKDYNDMLSELLKQKHLCIDHTSIDVLGKLNNILFMGNENIKVYAAVETKGIEDVKPFLENYSKTLVHDHAAVFRKFGLNHQECLAHILRNLKGIFENLKYNWSKEMRTFLQSLIHDRNEMMKKGKTMFSKTYISKSQAKYKSICKRGHKEMLNIKENKYNKDGFNMLRMLINFKENIMLFTTDFSIPHTSNLAERSIRISKTKMKISGQFYSLENAKMYAKLLTIIETIKTKKENILEGLKNIFAQKTLNLF
ncbi:MAG: transposase [Mycoplasmatota bacterium]